MARELRPCATTFLGGVAGQLDPVDGEHLTANKPFTIADRQRRTEHVRNTLAQRAHEVGDGVEVWLRIAAQGDEGDVLASVYIEAASIPRLLTIPCA